MTSSPSSLQDLSVSVIAECQKRCLAKKWSSSGEMRKMWAGVSIMAFALTLAIFLPRILEKIDAIRKDRLPRSLEASETGGRSSPPEVSIEEKKKKVYYVATALGSLGLILIVTEIFERMLLPTSKENCEEICNQFEKLLKDLCPLDSQP